MFAIGAAHAQTGSSVTMYGALDVNVNNFSAGSKAGGQSVTRVTDGTAMGRKPSRFGVRADEDLGGGLRAGALLEQGINVDTGSLGQGGLAWGRQAYVYLGDAKLGEIRLGRQYIESDISVLPTGIPFGNTLATKASVLVTGSGFALPLVLDIAARANNTIEYRTPTMAGFSGVALLAPGEGTADRFQAVSGLYSGASLSVAASYEWNTSRNGGGSVNKVSTLGVNYNFGAFKLLSALQTGLDLTNTSLNGTAASVSYAVPTTGAGAAFTATRLNAGIVGVEVPVGAMTYGATYISTAFKGEAGQSTKYNRLGFAATYDFSKRTGVYAGLTFGGGDLKDYVLERRVFQVGLKTVF